MNNNDSTVVTVVLRNPLDRGDFLTYYIVPDPTPLAQDWLTALELLLKSGKAIEKNFCFMGFPETARTLDYCVANMNQAIHTINTSSLDYRITEVFTLDNLYGLDAEGLEGAPNHELFNQIHNHFERLQGTVEGLSSYYITADSATKYAIRQLNLLCHEMESLILSQRQAGRAPEWIRPSQITTWLAADRYALTQEHRVGFTRNGYDRELGGVYMHWTQIGKTLMEVFRDEDAPELDSTVCEAITQLEYYSGEFDVEWGRSIVLDRGEGHCYEWHQQEQARFRAWLIKNGLDPEDTSLSLGYLRLGQVDLIRSFGTDVPELIWPELTRHLDIYSITVGATTQVYDYCWTDPDYADQQRRLLEPGYQHNSLKGP